MRGISISFLLVIALGVKLSAQLNTTYTSLRVAKQDPITVEYLDLEKKKYTKLPDSLFIFENLLELDLSKNKIDLLGDEIGELTSLQKLDLSRNSISVLPPQIGKLKDLRVLVLSKNSIKEVPEEFSGLESLEELILDGNQLTTFPSSLYSLSSLKLIDLRQMEIEENVLEEMFREMPDVRILHSTDCACGF